jgi:hypothetical protein
MFKFAVDDRYIGRPMAQPRGWIEEAGEVNRQLDLWMRGGEALQSRSDKPSRERRDVADRQPDPFVTGGAGS